MDDFDRNVFINCPFDDKYVSLLRVLLFIVYYLGLSPRISLERLDSAEPRIIKIMRLIEQSKYGIHDLSRLRATAEGEYFRLNMPFELGLDVGCQRYKGGIWENKRVLILESEKYRYQAAISDLSNSDIAVHKDDPAELARQVRNWLNLEARLNAPGPDSVFASFAEFMADNYDRLTTQGYSTGDIDKLPIPELMLNMAAWCKEHPWRTETA